MNQITNIRPYVKNQRAERSLNDEMVWVPGGTFKDAHTSSIDGSDRLVQLEGFWIDRYPVTNERFRAFVRTTGYVTEAERIVDAMDPGTPLEFRTAGSFVLVKPHSEFNTLDLRSWWVYLRGAHWRQPDGPHSSLDDRNDHPVTHISYRDAEAFARWAGKCLPTEAQWEYAARGGNDKTLIEEVRCALNRQTPGETGPVDASIANGYQLHGMIGNVWEWTIDDYPEPDSNALDARGIPNKTRPGDERTPYKIIKGGSHLCLIAGCVGCYNPSARSLQRADTSACDVGFRCMLPVRSGGSGQRRQRT